MSEEIELKFEIDSSSIKPLSTFLQNQRIIEQRSLHLANSYYDSLDNILRRHHTSIRIRSIEENTKKHEYEITLKSSMNEKSITGLHSRLEFNASLPNNKLNLSALPKAAFPIGLDRDSLEKQLSALFTTDFQRETWVVHFNQSQIEVALDQGIISTGALNLPILEVELELKLGAKVDLLLFAHKLSQFHIHLFSQSKAARGYRLVQGCDVAKIPQLDISNLTTSSILPAILEFWQTNEEYALAHNDLSFYLQTLQQVIDNLVPILPSPENEYSTELNQVYRNWLSHTKSITNIKHFAFSPINGQFKLYLMLLVLW
ncbi:CYTH domain-containing protein [Orbus sturtevantii]|uniref:CYTH domain-containing protein n=1 Tax=Orbus sturtevantii TaxID=3074109 RepID=UPI00370D49BC